jgi:hypothetical protein
MCPLLPPTVPNAKTATREQAKLLPSLTAITQMIRVHGDRNSLLAALLLHWSEEQLHLPSAQQKPSAWQLAKAKGCQLPQSR